MLTNLHSKNGLQLLLGLLLGIAFGFLLQKGGVTYYDVIINQLLLKDFTVVKIMLTAMVTGMIGVHVLVGLGLAQLHPKPGSLGMTIPGALIFGVGFGLLGYCPGTAVAAVGHGAADALLGGIVGMLLGAAAFAAVYPKLKPTLAKGDFGDLTLPRLLNVNPWVVAIPVVIAVVGLLWWLEHAGL
ncbi:MAG TPA: YeeE/YedE family protein [Planctomycetaceae bacterium]|nr:YeeE/YedE family protein [Planctomycetaceae bacterium]